ncbi:PIR Superfamily Protein [Plasmodium ovale wallikeri]|uniref:PIR Superfamily Protein n=1 Tax=Plasmodium ovale wallikeri TaxID=864142 RepID=A0A1A9AMB7_PLAOA|nr:PIR Superfamily Protein [Plasmodium ovale wallikeri]SBT57343.1 PIR Superfamily Protein [Plasmodium ovale wallikeri]
MSVLNEDPFFKKYGQKYTFLLELPLYAMYNMLHMFYTETYEDSPCKIQIYYNNDHSSDIHRVCKVLQMYLPELLSFQETHELRDLSKGCEYLSYWIYDNIKHINDPRENIRSLYDAINTFKLGRGLNDKCSNIKYFKISEDKFNKKKELFFHTENLLWIEKKYNPLHDKNSSLYKEYLDECAKYYKEIFLNNYCKNKKEYESELIDFKDKFNSTKKYLKSKGIQIILDDLQSPDLSKCSPEVKSPSVRLDDSQLQDLQNPGNGQQEAMVADIDGPTTDPGTLVGTGLGISFVMFLSYLFLYKFRGYQNFILPLINKKKKMFNNLEDEDNEFFHIPDPNQINLDNTSYHINYNSEQDY